VRGKALRKAAWADLTRPTPSVGVFDPDDLGGLPDPARRFLNHALTPGVELVPTVYLEMKGEIKLKTWTPFRARQVLRAGEGFVWEATAGKAPIRFRGGDTFWNGFGSLDFRIWGTIPVARESGPDVDRSAAGRLAAETVFWAPQALTTQMGASWAPIDSTTAKVALPVREDTVNATLTVDYEGRLQEVVTQRWGDPDPDKHGFHPFGAAVEGYGRFGGITIVTAGRVGWWWGTERQEEGEFFRFTLTEARIG